MARRSDAESSPELLDALVAFARQARFFEPCEAMAYVTSQGLIVGGKSPRHTLGAFLVYAVKIGRLVRLSRGVYGAIDLERYERFKVRSALLAIELEAMS